MATPKRKKQRSQAIVRLLLLAAILFCVNLIASRFHTGLDLTAEKRFTLSSATTNLLRSLKNRVVVEVYLEGKDLPPNAQALREAIRERLNSFQDIAGDKLLVRFIDPFEGKTDAQRESVIAALYAKGVYGSRIGDNAKLGDYSEKIIFPYAYLQIDNKEAGKSVMLMEVNGLTRDIDPAKAISVLEYKFATIIRMLQRPANPQVAWMTGHGEALGSNTWDALHNCLPRFFNVDTLDLVNITRIPFGTDAIVICKPTQRFEEKEKFKLDQYVMNGGHIFWMLDPIQAGMDSLMGTQQFMAVPYDLNLDDLLFSYGARLNTDLIEDRSCNPIGVITGYKSNGQPQIEAKPFPFLPVFEPTSRHPIVRNMSAIMSVFASSIDTVNPAIKKTILLESSNYSRVQASPVRVSLSMLRFDQKAESFNKPYRPFAMLMEGNFKSIYAARMTPSFSATLDSLNQPFVTKTTRPGSMILVADGDFALNAFTPKEPYPMGFWRDASRLYANQVFFLNGMQYLTDSMNMLDAQGKEIPLRQLDTERAAAEVTTWRWLNIGLPIALVLIFASVYLFFRQRKYATKIS